MADRLDEQVTWLGSDSSYRGEKTKRQRRRGHSKKQDRDMRTFYDADSFRPSSKQDISFLLSRSNSIATTLTSPGSTDVTALSSEGVQELARLLLWRQGLESEKHPAFTETELSYDDNLDDQDVHEAGSPTEDYETTFLRSLDQHSDSTTGRPMRNNCHADKLASRQRSPSPPNIQLLDVANIPPATITKEEFDVLPVTIQRKYFTIFERRHFTQDSNYHRNLSSRGSNSPAKQQQISPEARALVNNSSGLYRNEETSTSSLDEYHLRLRVDPTDQRFIANLPGKIRRLHMSKEERLAARDRPYYLTSDLDERCERLERYQQESPILYSPTYVPFDDTGSEMSTSNDTPAASPGGEYSAGCFGDEFNMLEADKGLDLRLYLDEYHINLREEIPVPNKRRGPSFRRHLSISKLPFSRSSGPYSREATASPSSTGGASDTITGSHRQRRTTFRTLSLASSSRQQTPEVANTADLNAAHYQNPDARKTLRAYLATPQKFDEALEYGFPALDEGQHSQEGKPIIQLSYDFDTLDEEEDDDDRWRTFLEDDESSIATDNLTVAESESPRTPEMLEHPAPIRPMLVDEAKEASFDPSLASSREMTLRMTLTRPDLRANKDDIYGWQQPQMGKRTHSRAGSLAPLAHFLEGGNRKMSIEKQFVGFDQENTNTQDRGVVHRFWERVRR